jgi:D-mannonate dehydratase
MAKDCKDFDCMINMSGKCHADECLKTIDYTNHIELKVNNYWQKELTKLRKKHIEKKELSIEELESVIEKAKIKLKALEDLNLINFLQKYYRTNIEMEIKHYSYVIVACRELINKKRGD